MTRTTDRVALDDWYAVASMGDLHRAEETRLLGQQITVGPGPQVICDGAALPVREKYGCLWTTLGQPAKEIFEIEEANDPTRRFVPCGWVKMRASGLRVVENFLDMAHFPFVHADILGSEPHTEVLHYTTEIRRDVDEVWATNCKFFQPQMTASRPEGEFAQLIYRVPAPFVVMLYRVVPDSGGVLDAIALFIQPLEEGLCRAQPVMYLTDQTASHTELLRFEQVIFLQDRIIVENQRPLLLPLEPRAEIPTRADGSSVAYRRWLKEKGLTYGTTLPEAAA
ncbi:aromatic ring-hydroxylating dioxygenase subunit alpha [Pseudooceanicola sp. CBS1P-1]|uniref:Aromatic ring-hydroxylating dioxygenase subunit alpha n=1 Tax=Pseudooceanicola albus TaxID=2692189 RepID=A0A6L7G2D8_9RHOB|nr:MULTISPECIES: aromatic ring-hydroxylating dioxygenase subunit alpha [Pseudooceanicola]MBT9385184.1 aromatic ring-hydroxylating dioxygenase subunit alpha [Pseudooceanicola endophyticus]MXN18524.1 aromatic ring-hydroxylating dioxygenase subunit alpha [Pseudooceanicola albus]